MAAFPTTVAGLSDAQKNLVRELAAILYWSSGSYYKEVNSYNFEEIADRIEGLKSFGILFDKRVHIIDMTSPVLHYLRVVLEKSTLSSILYNEEKIDGRSVVIVLNRYVRDILVWKMNKSIQPKKQIECEF